MFIRKASPIGAAHFSVNHGTIDCMILSGSLPSRNQGFLYDIGARAEPRGKKRGALSAPYNPTILLPVILPKKLLYHDLPRLHRHTTRIVHNHLIHTRTPLRNVECFLCLGDGCLVHRTSAIIEDAQ